MKKKYRTFNDYITENYLNEFNVYKNFVNKNFYMKFSTEEIEDMYSTIVKHLLEKNLTDVNDYNAYFWISLRNNTVRINKKKKHNFVEIKDEDFMFDLFENDDIFDLKLFIENCKILLNNNEFIVMQNILYSNNTIAKQSEFFGYTKYYVYNIRKTALEKMKKELNENKELYFK